MGVGSPTGCSAPLCLLLPFLPGTACACRHHRRGTGGRRAHRFPPQSQAWRGPPAGGGQHQPVSRKDGISPSQTPAKPQSYKPFMPPPGFPAADLIPEGNLSCVPPGDPGREKPLHVPQEHHSVHSVVFAAGLLGGQRELVSPGPGHQRPIEDGIMVPRRYIHVFIPGAYACFWKKGLCRCNSKLRSLK